MLGILSIILAPSALVDFAKGSQAARTSHGMSEHDILKLVGKIAVQLDTVKKKLRGSTPQEVWK